MPRRPVDPAKYRIRRGLHVAPFLSESGNPMLLDLDAKGVPWFLVEITSAVAEHRHELKDERHPCTHTLSDACGYYAREGLRRAYVNLWPAGVHWAPWRGLDGGRELVAIDERHRLVATMAVRSDDPQAAVNAHADLELLAQLAQGTIESSAAEG